MKYFKQNLIFNIFMFILSIFIFFNYPSIKKINKTEIDPLIPMQDYGFKEIEIYNSLLGKSKFNKEYGQAYHFNVSCDDEFNHYWIDAMVYKWEDNEIAEQFYKEEIELVRQEYVKWSGKASFSDTVVPKIPYEKAIQYMVPIDLTLWNADAGYSTSDVTIVNNEASTVFIVVLKDNYVMSINYTNDFLTNNENIKVFNDLLNESQTLFQ